jgi:aspartate carbamoyltransferase regulatory subunit
MVVINSIAKGIVIDHIRAGCGMRVLAYLNIDASRNTVAFIMNAVSGKYGRKDLIKIENITDVDLKVLGLIDHNATVNIIEDHIIVNKIKLKLPETVVNVIRCRNPRCVTSSEGGVPHRFHLVDERTKAYRCEYCDDIVKAGEF